MENRNFLKNQMTYIGFGDKSILDALDQAIDQGEPRFTLTVRHEKETEAGNKAKFEINFNKSSESDRYFLNTFRTTLLDKADNPLKTQLFHINGTKGITAKESINLLEGRAVKTVLKYSGEDSKVFVKLNFDETNKYGNYKYRTFNENYGVNTTQIIQNAQEESGLKVDTTNIDKLAKSLEKGNLVKSNFSTLGQEITGYVALSPEFKNLDHFDGNLAKIHRKLLGPEQNPAEKKRIDVSISFDDAVNKEVTKNANASVKENNGEKQAAIPDPVVLADITEKQATKFMFMQDRGKDGYPNVTLKQLATVPVNVFGHALDLNQRRDLLFGKDVQLDDVTTLRTQMTGTKELNIVMSSPDGGSEIAQVSKSDVEYGSPEKELKPFQSTEHIPEKSNALSR